MRPHFFCLLIPLFLSAAEPTILIDLHNDVTSATVKGLDIGPRRAAGHTDVERLREGGVGAVFFAAYVSRHYVPKQQAAHRLLEMIDRHQASTLDAHQRKDLRPRDLARAAAFEGRLQQEARRPRPHLLGQFGCGAGQPQGQADRGVDKSLDVGIEPCPQRGRSRS